MGEVGQPRCSARSKRTGERCRRPPRPGAAVCSMHGAAAPAAARAAYRRLIVAAQHRAAFVMGVAPRPDDETMRLARQLDRLRRDGPGWIVALDDVARWRREDRRRAAA